MREKNLIPKSKAKTAYGLLSEIGALAIEDPLRIAMAHWRCQRGDPDSYMPDFGYPACGTVGCIGGWTEVLKGATEGEADSILGLDSDQADELFYGPLCSVPNQQSEQHAKDVAAHIAAFQKKYRAQLLAKKV